MAFIDKMVEIQKMYRKGYSLTKMSKKMKKPITYIQEHIEIMKKSNVDYEDLRERWLYAMKKIYE